jgi:amino acid adenylation domain-containing protein
MNAVPLLHDFLHESARRRSDEVALVVGDERVTYGALEARSNALAHALVRRGVERGDRVLVFMENGVEAVIAFWGALKANAVVSLVHPHTKAEKLAYLLNDCRARVLVSAAPLSAVFVDAAARSRHLASIIVAGDLDPDRHRDDRIAGWAEAIDAERSDEPPPRRCLDIDLASIIYTSGSTGEPKGVMLTHRNMLTAATSVASYLESVAEDVVLCCLPLSFDYGLYQIIMACRVGARVVLEKGFAYPAKALAKAERERVTGFPGVPTMFAMLTEMSNLGDFDLSSLRYVTNTAAALSTKHIFALRALFPRAKVFSMYGLTECKRCTYLPPDDIDRKPASVGIAIPNTELWIVDQDGNKVGPNVVGQLVIRGATVMKGYWEKPEETAKKLRPGPLPGEQVLFTGDLCRLDDDGYLYFVGRMDDIIKSRGEKVAPKEIESVLLTMPDVREAAVVGVPDPTLGEAIVAFVALAEGHTTSEQVLRRLCQERLESFMVPTRFELRSGLPKSDNGKIDRRALR